MALLAEYIQRVRSEYPSNFSTLEPFPKATIHSPALLKGQTNRILVYRGCFSPPHIGHLALLKHAFEHGGRDLNMIAAIVKPGDGCSARTAKVKCSGKVISFSIEERIALWKNDERLPEWAWVFEDSKAELKKTMYCLMKLAKVDGLKLEFVSLCRPDNSGWSSEPHRPFKGEVTLIDSDGDREDVTFGGCKVMLICDAARKAVEFDTGRLKTFEGFEPWRRPMLETRVLISEEKAKAENVMAVLKEKELDEYWRLMDEAGSEAAAIGELAKRSVTEAIEMNQHVVVCHAKKDKRTLRRFVRLDRSELGFQETVVSGTILRNVIETEEAKMVREMLRDMALSPEVLGKMMGI